MQTLEQDRAVVTSSVPRVAGYHILEVLGQGGMGVVYRAEQAETGQVVALKTVRVARKQELMSIRREIHALTQLHHPAVVRFVDHGVEGGRPWYAMELLGGWTLGHLRDALHPRQRFGGGSSLFVDAPTQATPGSGLSIGETLEGLAAPQEAAPLPARRSALELLPRVLELTARLCYGLDYIHSQGIIHRDLKPANVFLRDDGSPVLVDFGLISRQGGRDGRLVLEAQDGGRGTPAYMAPEQIQGEAVDARADFYSLGCVLFELLTGRCPFEGETVFEVINHHLSTPPPAPSRYVDGIPEELDDLVLHLLAKRPRDRIGHADDVLAALRALGVAAASAESAARPALYRSVMVGRYAERNALNGVLADASAGRGTLVLLGGESGVGKTHLVTALTQVARRRSMRVITAECRPGFNTPLEAFRPVLQALLDRCLEQGAVFTRRVLGVRGKVLAAFEPALGELPGVRELPEPPRLPPDAERERVVSVLGEALSAYAQELPLLLLLDDLQWADELSLYALSTLGAPFFEERALALIGNYRSDEVEPPLQRLLDTPGARRIDLGRLGEDEITTMIGDMLAMREPPLSLVRYLASHSEGNPFFVAEYLRAAVAARLLHRQRGRWRLSDEGPEGWTRLGASLPGTLRDLVGRRLDALDPPARDLAALAAAVGREAPMELLFHAAHLSEAEGFALLHALFGRQVLEPGADGRVRFVHHKVMEVAAHAAHDQAARAHGAVASSIEALYSGTPDFELRCADLAVHWRRAGDLPRAVGYLERAAAHAVRTAAHADALAWLREAADLRQQADLHLPPLRRAAQERLIGECHLGLGDIPEARKHLLAAADLLGWHVPEESAPTALALLREVGLQALHRTLPPGLMPSSRSVEEITEGARTFEVMQAVARSTNRAPLILLSALRALNLAELGASELHRANGYALAQVIAGTLPWVRLAERYGDLAQRALDGCDDRAAAVWVDQMAAVYHTSRGHLLLAANHGQRAAELAEEIGYRFRWEESSIITAYAETYLGRLQDALRRYDAVMRSARRGAHRHLAWALAGAGRTLVLLGRDDDARARYDELIALPRHAMDPLDRLIIELTAAWGLTLLHEPERAYTFMESAFHALHSVPPTVIEISGVIADAADCWVWRWAHLPPGPLAQRALRRFEDVLALLKRFGRSFVLLKSDILYAEARHAWMRGRTRDAASRYTQSALAARDLGLVIQEARAWAGLAALPGHDTPAARARALHLTHTFQGRPERLTPDWSKAHTP